MRKSEDKMLSTKVDSSNSDISTNSTTIIQCELLSEQMRASQTIKSACIQNILKYSGINSEIVRRINACEMSIDGSIPFFYENEVYKDYHSMYKYICHKINPQELQESFFKQMSYLYLIEDILYPFEDYLDSIAQGEKVLKRRSSVFTFPLNVFLSIYDKYTITHPPTDGIGLWKQTFLMNYLFTKVGEILQNRQYLISDKVMPIDIIFATHILYIQKLQLQSSKKSFLSDAKLSATIFEYRERVLSVLK